MYCKCSMPDRFKEPSSEQLAGGRPPIRLLIADDHGLVRQGLRLQLEQYNDFQIVGEAPDGREAVRLAKDRKPDVVLMDIGMPLLNGIDAGRQILARQPGVAILFITGRSDEESILRALAAGARGYLLKESAQLDLHRAVEAVAQGHSFFSPAVARRLADEFVADLQRRGLVDSYELLTGREKEIFQLLAEGHSNKAVAEMLNLSQHTVETHRTRVQQKLDLHNAADMVRYAMKKKILL